jgi:hypothetical protein
MCARYPRGRVRSHTPRSTLGPRALGSCLLAGAPRSLRYRRQLRRTQRAQHHTRNPIPGSALDVRPTRRRVAQADTEVTATATTTVARSTHRGIRSPVTVFGGHKYPLVYVSTALAGPAKDKR